VEKFLADQPTKLRAFIDIFAAFGYINDSSEMTIV